MSQTPLTALTADPDREKKGFAHTPAEILKQPAMWSTAVADQERLEPEIEQVLVTNGDFVVLSGAGSSLNVGGLVTEMARGAWGPKISVVSGTDVLLAPREYVPGGKGTMVSLSRSGNSPEVVEAARRVAAELPSVRQMGVTCKREGELAGVIEKDVRNIVQVLPEGSYDRGLATTVSVTTMALAGLFMVAPGMRKGFRKRVESVASACMDLMERHAAVAQVLARKKPERVVFLGTGVMEAAAHEAALKTVEMTDGRVASMARNYLEFRHGPIAFLSDRTLLVCFGSAREDIRPYERDFMKQMSGVADGFVLSAGSDAESMKTRATSIGVPALDGLEALLAVVFAQMLGLFLSLESGLKPDRPGDRGLVNPVVQGVTIHPLYRK